MRKSDYEINHIKVLDGIRALAIIIAVWYHFWQQNWIIPDFGFINLDFVPRYGYLLVDMLVLLSGFCLFLPYARSMVYKEPVPNTKQFYINRVARIVPSYLVSMIISVIFIIILSNNISISFFIKDTITHLTFTHNLFKNTLLYTNYFALLWTVGVEVQFYIIFPFLAKRFMKKPIITYSVMVFLGLLSTILIRIFVTDYTLPYWVNNTLTFIPVYANGLLACWLYVKYTKNNKRTIKKDLIFTIIAILCIILYKYLCLTIAKGNNNIQYWQIDHRFILSCLFSVFIVCSIMAYKVYRYLFENKFMKFIAVISFNLYIYHHFIAVKLKEFRIPFWEGDTPPNMTGDRKWMWTYTILCIVISLLVAIIMTYGIEKPFAKKIKNIKLTKKHRKKK